MTSRVSDFDYPDLPDNRDDPSVRMGDPTYYESFENQKQELHGVWDADSDNERVLREVFLTNLVRLAWRNYSIEYDMD